MKLLFRILLGLITGLFFSTTICLFNQTILRNRHLLDLQIEFWLGSFLLIAIISFLIIPLINQKIIKLPPYHGIAFFIICISFCLIIINILFNVYLPLNNLMVFVRIPFWGNNKFQEIQISEVKLNDHVINLNDYQIINGCMPKQSFLENCTHFSSAAYVYENSEDFLNKISILLFDQEKYDNVSLEYNNVNFILIQNLDQNQTNSLMGIFINHNLINCLFGISLGLLLYIIFLFVGFFDKVHNHIWDMPVTLIFFFVIGVYIWLSTGGTLYKLYPTSFYYDDLSDAFIHGQTHLLIEPAKEMLALPDPYDPQANFRWRLHDASLYNGKYYLYWGPVPALGLIPFKLMFPNIKIRDGLIVLFYLIGMLFFLTKIILMISRELFNNIPKWVSLVCILALGLGVFQTWLLGRPFIYEAAISGGEFNLFAGFFCAYFALFREKHNNLFLFLAGTFWFFAIGSRATQVVAVGFLCLLVVWLLIKFSGKNVGLICRRVAALTTPLLIGGGGLLWYNFIRFGSITETGMKYAIGDYRIVEVFSIDHIFVNLYFYFVRFSSIVIQKQFPFIDSMVGKSELIPISSSYVSAIDTIGSLWSFPFIWLFPFLIGMLIYFRKEIANFYKDQTRKRPFIGLFFSLLAMSTALLPQLLFLGAPMRYLADFLPAFALFLFLIFCFCYSALTDHLKARNLLLLVMGALSIFSAMIGFLLGINSEYPYMLFYVANPTLFNWLTQNIHF